MGGAAIVGYVGGSYAIQWVIEDPLPAVPPLHPDLAPGDGNLSITIPVPGSTTVTSGVPLLDPENATDPGIMPGSQPRLTLVEPLPTTNSGSNIYLSTDFVVAPNGAVVPIPDGATGPIPANNGKGFQYAGGGGGKGLSPNISDVRIMDPTQPAGKSPGYPNGYASYSNVHGQPANPYTGKPVKKSDPEWHIPLVGPR